MGEKSSRAAAPTSHKGRGRRGGKKETEQEEQPKGGHRSETSAKDTVNTPDGEVFKENQAGQGCEESERQR